MTGAEHSHQHHQHDSHDVDWAELAAASELEAEVLVAILDETTARVAELLATDGIAVRRIVDIGPGPGVGTGALALAFPDAEVVAVDGSDAMLANVDARAARLGIADRVRTVHADLPGGLADLDKAEIVWAGLVMHHIGNERAALAAIHRVLVPGGLVVISEFGDPMRYLPAESDAAPPGFRERLAAAEAEWIAHMRAELPDATESADYPTMLREAGFELLTDTLVTAHLDPPLDADARAVAVRDLERSRKHGGDAIDPADLAALDALLDADNPNGIMRRPDLFLEGSRHLFIARANAV